MSRKRKRRLVRLINGIPPGFVVDAAWLKRQGFDPKSIYRYEKGGWIQKMTRGVYRLPPPTEGFSREEDWQSVVTSIQWIMGHRVHLGGLTSMAMRGHEHYLRLGGPYPVHLYGSVPSWLSRLPLESARFRVRSLSLFGGSHLGIENSSLSKYGVALKLFDDASPGNGEEEESADGPEVPDGPPPGRLMWPAHASSDERAVLEAMNDLPGRGTFHNLDMVFEMLHDLRPKLLTALLRECRSVKVRRLFFVFADRHGHDWLKHLDKTAVDFGSGPRALVKGGKIHPEYRIYVPEEMLAPDHYDYLHNNDSNI